MKERCSWCGTDEIYVKYHDEEWGTPVHDDRLHYEFILLECMQAGLSWKTILHKREAFREAFDNFDVHKISNYSKSKIEELMQNKGIIRNRKKIEAAVSNAKCFLQIQDKFGSFDNFIWSFTDNKVVCNDIETVKDIPVSSALSDTISMELKKYGFKFVGSVTIYAHIQAIGIVNDHMNCCFKK
ncbi:MAG: DNA-3-methyladenine glycosylase I [Candidatus Delongbacteria bacterium]|nr:DNA-3-methyladenine glycosylase I [Candidatus Delongbacteria bacterium]MBN2833676.1 DNA-3-methyladenine glycosylase I [Candidatus Delongbacteria bacterium]